VPTAKTSRLAVWIRSAPTRWRWSRPGGSLLKTALCDSHTQSLQSALDQLGFKAPDGSRATLQVPQGGFH